MNKNIDKYDKYDKYANDFDISVIESIVDLSAYKHKPSRRGSFLFFETFIDGMDQRGKRILDVGCGVGENAVFHACKGWDNVSAIDISSDSIEVAKQLAEKFRVQDKIQFQVGSSNSLPYPDNYFDIVYSHGLLSFVNKSKTIMEMRRVVKKNGLVIICDTLRAGSVINGIRSLNSKFRKKNIGNYKDILNDKDIDNISTQFKSIEVYKFNFISAYYMPFEKIISNAFPITEGAIERVGGVLAKIDNIILRCKFLKRYAFKTCIILKK